MGRTKKIDLRKDVIIEMAIANDYKSIPELRKLIKTNFQNIDNYFKEEAISNLIENKKFDNPTVNGIKPIKYKLKSCPDNLLAIFDYLDTERYQKRIMETDYYKNFIPYIDKKARESFSFTDSDNKFYDRPEAKKIADISYNLSPTAVNLILRAYLDKNDEKLLQKILTMDPPSKILINILNVSLMIDMYKKNIDVKELFKFQTLEPL